MSCARRPRVPYASRSPSSRSARAGRLLFAALVAVSSACADDALSRVFPRIEVEPSPYDFGVGIVGADNVGRLLVKNTGQAALEISGYSIEPEGSVFTFVDGPKVLAASSSAAATLTFRPRLARERYTADLVVFSDDPERGELRVPLRGEGGVREIDVQPTEIDFGIVDEGTAPTREVVIANVGKDALHLSSVDWARTSTSGELTFTPSPFVGRTLAPMTSTVVTVRYSPRDLGADRAVLVVRSDDDDEPVVEVPVRARANLAPVAVAWGCDPLVAGQVGCDGANKRRLHHLSVRQRLMLDGRESYDPEGGELTIFAWRVVEKPAASSAAVFHSTDDRTLRRRATGDFELDTGGRYVVRLVVVDDRGLASFLTATSTVEIRPKDIEVLLRWDVPIDVDLHLVRGDGRLGDYGTGVVGTSTGTDVSTFNRAPNWGDLGTSDDDPRLDIDDVQGRGPEIVSLDRPGDGQRFEVWAHVCDSRNVRLPSNVTIEVYRRGERVAQIPDNGAGYALAPGEAWNGATIVWRDDGPRVEVTDGLARRPQLLPGLCRSPN